ncbi:MAG: hypothetical protein HN482_03610 [Bdellovibrionales bacterium]|nr:hypothetical protein [Bdellovibrionales bacterium]
MFVFWSFALHGRLSLAIDLVYKTGLDNGLVLTSELHSVEEVGGAERIKLKMNNGPSLEVQAQMAPQNEDVYGPPALVRVVVTIFSEAGKRLEVMPHSEMFILLGESARVSHQGGDGKMVIVEIKPLY